MRVLVTSVASSRRLCEALCRQPGIEVAALQPAFIDLGDFGTTRTQPDDNAPYLLQPARVFPVRPYPYSIYLSGALSLVRRFRPHAVYHIGEPSELGTWQLVRLMRKYRPGARIILVSYENVQRHFRGFPRCLRGWAMQATLPRVDMIAAGTRSAAEILRQQGFDSRRIRVIYPGVDPQHFYRRDPNRVRTILGAERAFVVGYAGRLVPEKGVDLLLHALSVLPERFVLVIVGTGRQESELRALAESLKVADRVRWVGAISREEMPEYMSAFDAVVLPSRSIPTWQEQFGRVLAEAMLCETPVVGSSCGAIAEVIGDAGLVFPENEAEALAECLRQLGDDPDLCRQLGERGLQRARREFTIDVQITRIMQALSDVMSWPPRN